MFETCLYLRPRSDAGQRRSLKAFLTFETRPAAWQLYVSNEVKSILLSSKIVATFRKSSLESFQNCIRTDEEYLH